MAFKKGNIPWNAIPKIQCICKICGKEFWKQPCRIKSGRGTYCSISCHNRDRLGIKHGMWKGNNVGYVALHLWVRRQKGKPLYCEFDKSHTSKRFEWANLDKKYTRNLSTWVSLCVSCHRKYDYPRG